MGNKLAKRQARNQADSAGSSGGRDRRPSFLFLTKS